MEAQTLEEEEATFLIRAEDRVRTGAAGWAPGNFRAQPAAPEREMTQPRLVEPPAPVTPTGTEPGRAKARSIERRLAKKSWLANEF